MCWKTIIVVLIACAINCVAQEIDVTQTEPLSSNFHVDTETQELTILEGGIQEYGEPTGIISLSQALSSALMQNPELKVFAWNIRANEALVLQSAVLPNPEVEFETQNFAGLGRPDDFDASETTIRLSQLIELGGKRKARKEVAILDRDLTRWDYESKKIDIFTDTTKAFVAVLAAQERLKLLEDLISLSEETYNTVSERVKAGKVSPVEETRTGILLSANRIEKERAQRAFDAARYNLASFWGSASPLFTGVAGNLDRVLPEIPPVEKLNLSIPQNPDIARWTTELESRRAAVKLEKANVVPDLTVAGGYDRLNNMGDRAFVLGVSIPLPVFNRNKGNVLAAQRRLASTENQRKSSLTRVQAELAQNYHLLWSSHQEVTALKDTILPSALKVYEATREGYRQGKFDYLSVLDAQITLSQARIQYIDALFNYHTTVTDIERSIGTSMESVLNPDLDAEGDNNE